MTDAEHAVQEAAANIPAEVRARFETADKLSDEDRETIIEIARQALARSSPSRTQRKPKSKPERQAKPNRGEVMSDTTASLRRKIDSAGDLQSVVRTMKALAASSIGQYEKSVRALADYYRTVELGLGVCFRESEPAPSIGRTERTNRCEVRSARSCSAPTRDWWASSTMWWPIMRSRRSRLCRANPKSGPSVSAFMRAWRTRACR